MKILLLFFIICLIGCYGYNILLFPIPSNSHVFSFISIGKKLTERGNKVYVLLDDGFPMREEWVEMGIGVIRFGKENNFSKFLKNMEEKFWKNFINGSLSFSSLKKYLKLFGENFENILYKDNDDLFRRLEALKFDVVVLDSIFLIKSIYFLPHRLSLPYITYQDLVDPWSAGSPWPPSVHLNQMLSMSIISKIDNFNFWERLVNTVTTLTWWVVPMVPECSNEVFQEYQKYGKFKNIDQLIKKSLLFLTTDDPLFDRSLPRTNNMIQIGGLTTELTSPSGIPETFIDFMKVPSSKGTIIISFGSMVSEFPLFFKTAILDMIKNFSDYQFIWKIKNLKKNEELKNLMICDWMPQNDLLGHSSIKLFITHSGNNGQFESLFRAVPMVAIPLLGDQQHNAKRIVDRGFGEAIELKQINSQILIENVKKVLENPSYKEKIWKASQIFKSRLQTPSERASFWIEHVIKFGGKHLEPAGRELMFYQYLLLDVFLFLLFLLLVFCLILWIILKKICCRKKNKTKIN